jgi:hypothetical protein
MTSDSPHRTELLTEQLNLLRRLAAVYRESYSAFTTLNLGALQQHIATLESLGRELGRMAISSGPVPAELAAARAEVNSLNKTFALVAQRSLRTNKVMQHLLGRVRESAAAPSFHAYV